MIIGTTPPKYVYGRLHKDESGYYLLPIQSSECEMSRTYLIKEFLPFFGRSTNVRICHDSIEPFAEFTFIPTPSYFDILLYNQGKLSNMIGEEIHIEFELAYPEESSISIIGDFSGLLTEKHVILNDSTRKDLIEILSETRMLACQHVDIQAYSPDRQCVGTIFTTKFKPSYGDRQLYVQQSTSLRNISDILKEAANRKDLVREHMCLVVSPTNKNEITDAL